jgi:1-aminocyclopropane-1-carboxylate deaminase
MDSATFPSCIVSYGGPQSNSMLAIAAVVQYHNSHLEQLHNYKSVFDHDDDIDDSRDTTDNIDTTITQPSPFVRRRFVYYTKKLPSFLRNQPSGNLFRALSLGMELVEVSNDEYNNLFASADHNFIDHTAPMQIQPPIYGDSVWIPQGGACSMAMIGTARLAQEIHDYWRENGNNQPLSVCIPGGTCSTALFVHRALQNIQASIPKTEKLDIEVVVIPCVGDEGYAQRQMTNLNVQVFGSKVNDNDGNNIPTILRPTPSTNKLRSSISTYGQQGASETNDYYRFGEPNANILQTFRELRDEYDLVVDLLYGAPSWTILFRHWTSILKLENTTTAATSTFNPNAPIDGRRIMYVHSGGVEGINSQLLRYKHKNLICVDEIQLPGRDAQFPSTSLK